MYQCQDVLPKGVIPSLAFHTIFRACAGLNPVLHVTLSYSYAVCLPSSHVFGIYHLHSLFHLGSRYT